MWLPLIFTYALVRGPLSIWLQSSFDCAAEFRVADIVIIQLGLLTWLTKYSFDRGHVKKHLLTVLKIIGPLTAVAVAAALINQQSPLELVLLFGFELGWVVLSVFAVIVRPKLDRSDIKTKMALAGAAVGGLTALAYTLSISDDIDSAVGYGQCGTTEALLVGGDSGWLRLRGLARNPNETGALMLIPLAVVASKLSLKRSLWWLAAVLISLAILLSFSRSAMLGAGLIGMLTCWGLVLQKTSRKNAALLFIGAFFILIAAAVFALNSQLGQELILHQDDDSGSTSIRVGLLETSFDKFTDSPLLGSSLGAAGAAGRALDVEGNFESESYMINVVIELGILGLLSLGWALMAIWRRIDSVGRTALLALLLANLVAPTIINPAVGLVAVILVIVTTDKRSRDTV